MAKKAAATQTSTAEIEAKPKTSPKKTPAAAAPKIYLAEAVTLIGKNLRKGNKVRIAGLGVFQVKKRAARKGRNPANGEPIKIKATKRVGFAVARDLKAKL